MYLRISNLRIREALWKCEQIGRFLKILEDKISNKSSPNEG